jgi:GNAT superfamily N-acetyltransferase
MRDADIVLTDGTTIHVRSIEPTDAVALRALHGRLSDRTRYMRYFRAYPRINDRDLAHFVQVDHRDREALVAVLGDDLIAVGRYDRLGPGEAEVAFAVEDAYQQRGIAPRLLERLADAARPTGIRQFVAEVLPHNTAMLHVFANSGYPVKVAFDERVTHVTIEIA